MHGPFRLVKNALTNHPIIANSIVYGTLCVGAELSQQTVTRKILTDDPKPCDKDTVLRYSVYGTCIGGPILSLWYRWLDSKFIGTSRKIVIRKLLLDQFIITPPLLVIFFISMSLMERKKHLLEECTQKFFPTFAKSCMFWLPAQAVNFFLVPPVFRVAYVGTCSFAWVNILCWVKRQEY